MNDKNQMLCPHCGRRHDGRHDMTAMTEMLWATCPRCDGTYGTTDPEVHTEIEAATASQCGEWHADK